MVEPRLRVVFDTNVYIPAALNAAGASDMWLRIANRAPRSFDLYVSEAILTEVARKLRTKFDASEQRVVEFLQRVREAATVVESAEQVSDAADPDDNMVLECALAAKAQLIVSADKHLLRLHPYKGIGICHPKELRNIFKLDADRAA